MTRLLFLAALALPVPLSAQGLHDTHADAAGAAAGRSPQRAFRPLAVADGCARAAMHSVPAGKGHVFGRHALGRPCSADRIVAAGPTATRD